MPTAFWPLLFGPAVFALAILSAWLIRIFVDEKSRPIYGQLVAAATTSSVALIAATWAWSSVQEQLNRQSMQVKAQQEQIYLQRRVINENLANETKLRFSEMRGVRALFLIVSDNLEVAELDIAKKWLINVNGLLRPPVSAIESRKEYLNSMSINTITLFTNAYRSEISDKSRQAIATFAYCAHAMATLSKAPLTILTESNGSSADEKYIDLLKKLLDETNERMGRQSKACHSMVDKALSLFDDELSVTEKRVATFQSLADQASLQ